MAYGPQSIVDALKNVILTTRAEASSKNYDGKSYVTGYYFSGVSNGTTVNILLSNPLSSGRVLNTTQVNFSGTGVGTMQVKKNVTVSSTGTPLPILNRNTKYGDNTLTNSYYGATYSGGGAYPKEVLPAGIKETVAGSAPSTDFVIGPGDNLVLEITNGSGASNQFSVRVTFDEE